MRVDDLFGRSARAHANKPALVCAGVRYTYADVDALANNAAHALVDAGVARGDRVAFCLDNSVAAVASILGALKAGAVAMPLHASTKRDKLNALLRDADARALVTAPAKRGLVDDDLRSTCALVSPDFEKDDEHTTFESKHIDLDLAFLLYTSGSTGTPKGVMHAHLGFASVIESIAQYLALDDSDVVGQVLPLSFGYGLTQMFSTFAVGATLVLEKSFAYPQATLATFAQERVTCFAMVPTIAALLARNDLSAHDLSSLRTLTNAGGALPVPYLRALRDKLPNARVVAMYGQTECIRASYLDGDALDTRPTSVGRGIPNQDMWIVDDTGTRIVGEGVGELVVRGAHVMRGYWRQAALTSEKLRVGPVPGERVLHTGDLFRVDDEGFFHFVARKDDIIKTRGEKVSPKEVEDALLAHAEVVECAVIGVDDDVLGQAVHAHVVARTPIEERALLRHCAERLEDYAVPKRVFVVDALPKNDNGKIDKRALKNALA